MIEIECAHCDYNAKLNACDRDVAKRLLDSHACAPKRFSWIEGGKVKSAQGAGLVSLDTLLDPDTVLQYQEMIKHAMRIAPSNPAPPTMAIYLVSEDN